MGLPIRYDYFDDEDDEKDYCLLGHNFGPVIERGNGRNSNLTLDNPKQKALPLPKKKEDKEEDKKEEEKKEEPEEIFVDLNKK